MKKIVHIINGLGNGGAEMMLYKLLQQVDPSKLHVEVISLVDFDVMGPKIEALGITVHPLFIKNRKTFIKNIFKSIKLCKDADFIQTWLYHANLYGFFVKIFVPKAKLIWGIHNSALKKETNKSSTILISKIGAFASYLWVYKIVCCSKNTYDTHKEIHYQSKKMVVIPNGFDLDLLQKNKYVDKLFIPSLKLPITSKIILSVGRWDSCKDYPNLLYALSKLIKRIPDCHLLLCGTGLNIDNADLSKLITELSLWDFVSLLGRRDDIPYLMSNADVFVSSSVSEAFPNTIGEAMACELPCVVTDVGDCSYIVGECGIVVPPSDPSQLANGILNILTQPQAQNILIGKLSRERVLELYEIKKVSQDYFSLYK